MKYSIYGICKDVQFIVLETGKKDGKYRIICSNLLSQMFMAYTPLKTTKKTKLLVKLCLGLL